MCRIPDMVSLTSINSLNINMMKIKRYLLSTFCLCLFTACDSDDNLLCYGTHTEIEGDSELLAMERRIVRKLLIVLLLPCLPKGE